MRGSAGVAAVDDLAVLLVAIIAFSLFFASVVVAYTARESRERGDRLQAEADELLEATMTDPRWTSARGLFVAADLQEAAEMVAALAGTPHFLTVIWDLRTDDRWTFGGPQEGDRRTAATSANVLGSTVDPARIAVTVWGL